MVLYTAVFIELLIKNNYASRTIGVSQIVFLIFEEKKIVFLIFEKQQKQQLRTNPSVEQFSGLPRSILLYQSILIFSIWMAITGSFEKFTQKPIPKQNLKNLKKTS